MCLRSQLCGYIELSPAGFEPTGNSMANMVSDEQGAAFLRALSPANDSRLLELAASWSTFTNGLRQEIFDCARQGRAVIVQRRSSTNLLMGDA